MAREGGAESVRSLSSWEHHLFGVKLSDVPDLIPGTLMAALLAYFSIWLSDYFGTAILGFYRSPISAVMMAVLLGLFVNNTIHLPQELKPGLTFTVKKVLRLGIVLLGIRLSVFDVLRLGGLGLPVVLFCVAGALFFTRWLTKWLKLPECLGTLIAVGTSICGVSAIVSTGPAIDADDEEIAYAVAVVTVFGIGATLVYPYLAHYIFAGDPTEVGLFLGTSVHDTSQVAGSALVYSETFGHPLALDVATVTKLVRNIFMAVVIPFMAFHHRSQPATTQDLCREKPSLVSLLPLFVLGFLATAAIRSLGDASVNLGGEAFRLWASDSWQAIHSAVKRVAVNMLVTALAGVGLTTSFRKLRRLGIRPFIVGLGAALMVGVLSFGIISFLGAFITW